MLGLYVNKMAFLERGCGEFRSIYTCLVIIHSKYGLESSEK